MKDLGKAIRTQILPALPSGEILLKPQVLSELELALNKHSDVAATTFADQIHKEVDLRLRKLKALSDINKEREAEYVQKIALAYVAGSIETIDKFIIGKEIEKKLLSLDKDPFFLSDSFPAKYREAVDSLKKDPRKSEIVINAFKKLNPFPENFAEKFEQEARDSSIPPFFQKLISKTKQRPEKRGDMEQFYASFKQTSDVELKFSWSSPSHSIEVVNSRGQSLASFDVNLQNSTLTIKKAFSDTLMVETKAIASNEKIVLKQKIKEIVSAILSKSAQSSNPSFNEFNA